MAREVLVMIGGDPRTSGRPAEGIRIAAGVGAWKKARIRVYLREAAVLVLSEYPDELVDEDHFVRYLPIIREWGEPVLVEAGSPWLRELGEASMGYEEAGAARVAEVIRGSEYVLRF